MGQLARGAREVRESLEFLGDLDLEPKTGGRASTRFEAGANKYNAWLPMTRAKWYLEL